MIKYLILLITIIAVSSCTAELEKHTQLIDFNVIAESPEKLYQIESFKEEDYWDRPRELKTEQIGDVLKINFEVFEGNSSAFDGNIEIKQDTLFLKIGKGLGIKELEIHQYQFEILNAEKREYKIEIINNLSIEELYE